MPHARQGAERQELADEGQLLPVPRGARAYEASAARLPESWRRAAARLAAASGMFDAYRARVQAWRSGARPRAAPDLVTAARPGLPGR